MTADTREPIRLPQWRADTPGTRHRNHLNNAGAALMPASVQILTKGHCRAWTISTSVIFMVLRVAPGCGAPVSEGRA